VKIGPACSFEGEHSNGHSVACLRHDSGYFVEYLRMYWHSHDFYSGGGGLSHRVAETKSRRRQGRAEGMELTSRRCIWGRVSEVGVPLPSGMGSGEEAVPCLAGMFVFTRRA